MTAGLPAAYWGVVTGAVLLTIVAATIHPTPTRLEEVQKRELIHKIHTELLHGQSLYNLPEARVPTVRFEVNNPQNAAESSCTRREAAVRWEIRINERLAAAHYRDYLRETVPHEVAHLLLCQLGLPWDAHGSDWETIVRDMGAIPRPTHSYGEVSHGG